MTDGLPAERRDRDAGSSQDAPRGMGRWLLTWVGVFSMVVVTAIIFIVAAFIVAN